MDGSLIAARLLYYPYMKQDFKQETLFEIGLAEVLASEKITTFSITEHTDVQSNQSLNDIMLGSS